MGVWGRRARTHSRNTWVSCKGARGSSRQEKQGHGAISVDPSWPRSGGNLVGFVKGGRRPFCIVGPSIQKARAVTGPVRRASSEWGRVGRANARLRGLLQTRIKRLVRNFTVRKCWSDTVLEILGYTER